MEWLELACFGGLWVLPECTWEAGMASLPAAARTALSAWLAPRVTAEPASLGRLCSDLHYHPMHPLSIPLLHMLCGFVAAVLNMTYTQRSRPGDLGGSSAAVVGL